MEASGEPYAPSVTPENEPLGPAEYKAGRDAGPVWVVHREHNQDCSFI